MLSRVADSLYWMSRYLERAEHTARLVDVSLNMMLEHGRNINIEHQQLLLNSLNVVLPSDGPSLEDAYAVARNLTFDTKNSSSVVSCIVAARENARQVREEISSEMYEQLNRLYLKVRSEYAIAEWTAQPYEFFADVKEGSHLFQGVTDDTLAHGEAWQFIRLGRAIERVNNTVRLLRAHYPQMGLESSSPPNYQEWIGLLRSCTCFEAYCKQYTADLKPRSIIEFLLLDHEMPRSLRFCTDRIESALIAISEDTGGRVKDSVLLRAAGRLKATLEYATIDDILRGGLAPYLEQIGFQCGQIHAALFSTYIRYTLDTNSN